MKKQNIGVIRKMLILLFSIYIILNGSIIAVNAQTTTVSVLPATIEISEPGQSVTLDLNITDVTNLYGYEIKIWYYNDIVNVTSVTRPAGHFLQPIDPMNQFIPKWEIKNDYNETHGRLWLSFTLLSPEPAKSGSGILAKITFLGLSVGSTPVILNNYPGNQGPVKLSNNLAQPIPHVAQDGYINVIPELSAAMLLTFLSLSLAAILMLKLFRRRMHVV